jgi:hypothetical protein
VVKVILPLVFLLFADGGLAGRAAEAPPAPVAADRSPADAKAESKADTKKAGKPEGKDAQAKEPAKAEGQSGKDASKEGAAKEAPKALAHAGKKTPGKDNDRAPTPAPGISATAMNEEMATRVGQQKALSERERLEALSNDLSRTRSALREETVRLETLMEVAKQTGAKPAAAAAKPAAPAAGATPGEGPRTEGGAMPLGDPLQPSAYYRPAPPPPNFAVQVEVVSKAMKSMKPEQAAGILGHLERGLAAEVLQRMRPADAGAILGFLKPEVGAALAAEIVSRPPVGRAKDKDADKEKP